MPAETDMTGATLPPDKDLGEGAEDMGDADADQHVEKQLDKGLKETFPASDPVSINPGAD